MRGAVVGAALGLGTLTGLSPASGEAGFAAPAAKEAPAEFQVAAIDFYMHPPEPAVAASAPPSPARATTNKIIAVGKGDTLMKVLVKAGADRRQAHGAIVALAKVFDPRRLKVGQKVTLTFLARDGEAGAPELVSVALDAAIDREVVAIREGGGDFVPRELTKQFDTRLTRGDGKIKYSLYVAATRAGLPVSVIVEMIRILSWDVDFQRDIQPGDVFEVVYERDFDEHGQAVREGAIRFVSLSLGGVELAYYRYQPSDDDHVDYFDAEGRSVRKALLRTPVDGAKLTSGYGKRRHPILGYNRVHRGVDFGAPKGTPIYAAGDGMIEMAKWEGNYGRYVRLRHNNEIKTAYAHMSRFAKGARKGKRVRQGQVIGYVGSTGMSTGPHLHYEVIVKGRKKNPMRVKLPTGRQLKGKELKRFDKSRQALAAKIARLRATGPVLADNVD